MSGTVTLVKHTLTQCRLGYPMTGGPTCPRCGSNNVITYSIPGRVMGGVWVDSSRRTDCRYCKRTS